MPLSKKLATELLSPLQRRKTLTASVGLVLAIACIFLLGFAILFGTRDYTVGSDSLRYAEHFDWISRASYTEVIDRYSDTDLFFFLATKPIIEVAGTRGAFLVIALFLVSAIVWLCLHLPPRYLLLGLLLYATMPTFHQLGVNVIRHGSAVAALLIGMVFLLRNRLIGTIAWYLVALFLHASSIIFILLSALSRFVSLRFALITFVTSVILAISGIGIDTILTGTGLNSIPLLQDRIDPFLEGEIGRNYRIGFRFDFFLYTIAPMLTVLVMGSTTAKRKRGKHLVGSKTIIDQPVTYVAKLYILLSAFFMLTFSLPYSDRFGLFAWMLAPWLLVSSTQLRHRSIYRTITWVPAMLLILSVNVVMLFW